MSDTREGRADRWGQWLKSHLDANGWRQADLVNRGHLSRTTVSRWTNGLEAPNHRNTLIVANVLGVDHAEALEAAGFVVTNIPPSTTQLAEFSDEDLLAELVRRASERAEGA